MRQHRHHPVGSGHRRQIHAGDARMGMRALPDQHHQRVIRRRNIVDIDGASGDMLVGAVMAQRGPNIAGDAIRRHIRASRRVSADRPAPGPVRRGTGVPVRSMPYFSSRLAAT